MKISIITVVHNNVKHIEGCIDSIVNQTYKDLEYIIVDGGSTDGTVNIIKNLEGKIKNSEEETKNLEGKIKNSEEEIKHLERKIKNCKVVSEKDNGIYDAINKGIKNSSGDVIGLLHSDDVFADDYVIEKVMDKFVKKKSDSVYGDLEYVKANDINKRIRYWQAGDCDIKKLKHGWMPPHPAFFVKKEVFGKFGLYSTDYKVAADYEMVLRLLWRGKITTAYLPVVITKMRWGGASNRDFSSVMLKSREDYKALKANSVPNPIIAVFLKNVSKLKQFIGN
jgi:glycosyltransferase involved in cell wall biosynthesis